MIRRTFIMLMVMAVIMPITARSEAAISRVYDQAQLFTITEENKISDDIAAFQKETGMDFVVVTSNTAHDDATQQQIADEFYDRGGFGLDEENSGILYYIDMYERWHYISTTGAMIDYMTDERIDRAIESCKSYLSAGDYDGAVANMISIVRNDIADGIPDWQYRYDVETGEWMPSYQTANLLLYSMLGAFVCGFALGQIF